MYIGVYWPQGAESYLGGGRHWIGTASFWICGLFFFFFLRIRILSQTPHDQRDGSPAAYMQFLEYAYSDYVDWSALPTAFDWAHLARLAHLYRLERLCLLVAEKLNDVLTPATTVEFLRWAGSGVHTEVCHAILNLSPSHAYHFHSHSTPAPLQCFLRLVRYTFARSILQPAFSSPGPLAKVTWRR